MQQFPTIQSVPKRRWAPRIFWIAIVIICLLLGMLFSKAYSFGSKVFVHKSSFFKKVTTLVFSGSASSLKGEAQGRINILLLGYGGEGHDGPFLTDTVILASINPETKQVALNSIPRDYLWEDGKQKINFAFASGYQPNHDFNEAGEKALGATEKITGLEIPYFASIDFKGFEKAIDRLGGVDVQIDNSFTDNQYPNDTFGYLPTLTFNKGLEKMNGVRALQFVRSRHGTNLEDSDIARSKRQAKILDAFKTKVQDLGILSNSGTINDLLDILADHAHTNIEPSELLHLAEIVKSTDVKITSESMDLEAGMFCDGTKEEIGYVIFPCAGITTSQVQTYFKNSFSNSAVRTEAASLILENAGRDPEYYNLIKKQLVNAGVVIYEVPYRGLPLSSSAFYKVNEEKPATISYIQQLVSTKALPKPESMTAKTDLVLFVAGGN